MPLCLSSSPSASVPHTFVPGPPAHILPPPLVVCHVVLWQTPLAATAVQNLASLTLTMPHLNVCTATIEMATEEEANNTQTNTTPHGIITARAHHDNDNNKQ